MRRRPRPLGDGTPLRLVDYNPADWPGSTNPAQDWYDARDAWNAASDGADLPDAPAWPDVPFDPSTL